MNTHERRNLHLKVLRITTIGFEVTVMVAALVASALVARELWARGARGAEARPSIPVPTTLISLEASPAPVSDRSL